MVYGSCVKNDHGSHHSCYEMCSLKPLGINDVVFQNVLANSSKHGIDFPFFYCLQLLV